MASDKKSNIKFHYTEDYLLHPMHKVTVNVIGAGGTGSQVITNLARLDYALRALGHPGLHVRLIDDDIVTEANMGRQLFTSSDIGLHKSTILITKVNRFFNQSWESYPVKYNKDFKYKWANIIITCVDKVDVRKQIAKFNFGDEDQTSYIQCYYWLDFGNSQTLGQCVLGTLKSIKQPTSEYQTLNRLANIVQMFPDEYKKEDDNNEPSCSLAQALNKQDLFINSTLVQFGMNILWKLFREARIQYQGAYVNLDKLTVVPIPIAHPNKYIDKTSKKKKTKP